MTREECFKVNFPKYVTEKGECLSPYFDLFNAGVELATYELYKGCIQTLTKENTELKAKIEKMKQDLDTAKKIANKQEQGEIYSVLNDIYNNNFEVITSVSN